LKSTLVPRIFGECGVTSTTTSDLLGIVHKRCTEPAIALLQDRIPLCATHHARYFAPPIQRELEEHSDAGL
jgi:hypothetical protein